MSQKNCYSVVLLMFFLTYNCMGNSAVSGLGDSFKELHRRLSVQATPKIASMSIDSVDNVFSLLLKNNSPIKKVLRANSSGIVINESTQDQKNHIMRNISGQQWFDQVRKTEKPYYGVTRDSSGILFLFWVWPLKNAGEQFAGALAAKIDPACLVQYIDENRSFSLKIMVNSNTVYICNWQNSQNSESISCNISEALVVTSYYKSQSQASSSAKKTESILKVDTPVPESIQSGTVNALPKEKAKKSVIGIILRTFLLIALIGGLIIAFFFKIGKKWQSGNRASNKAGDGLELSTTDVSEEVMDLVDDHLTDEEESLQEIPITEPGDVSSADPQKETITSSSENREMEHEKKETVSVEAFYKQIKGDIFRKAVPHFKPVQPLRESSEESVKQHNELYEEIHGQIIHWVVCESARLSNCLEELTSRINRLEGVDGPELDSIKQDALRISKEIEIFKKHFNDPKE